MIPSALLQHEVTDINTREPLGEGGFAEVYLGKLKSNGLPVALKVSKPATVQKMCAIRSVSRLFDLLYWQLTCALEILC